MWHIVSILIHTQKDIRLILSLRDQLRQIAASNDKATFRGGT
jgi:hypothetical protein